METTVVPIFVTGIVFGFSALIVAMTMWARHRARQLRHETIRLAIEKGQPLPPELLREAQAGASRRTDLSRGILLLFLGAGISLFLWTADRPRWGVGFILVALGLGFVVSHALSPRARAPEGEPRQ